MDITLGECRVLLGIVVRGIRDNAEDDKKFKGGEKKTIRSIANKVEDAYDDLYPYEPDTDDI